MRKISFSLFSILIVSVLYAQSPTIQIDDNLYFQYDLWNSTAPNPYPQPTQAERDELTIRQNELNNKKIGIRPEWADANVKFSTITAPIVKTSTIQAMSPLTIFAGEKEYRFENGKLDIKDNERKNRRRQIDDLSNNPADLRKRIEIIEEILGLR